jgi:hypothetical protein
LFVKKIILDDFCFINHSVGNTVTDEFTDQKARQIFFSRHHSVDIFIDEDGISQAKKFVCNYTGDLFLY